MLTAIAISYAVATAELTTPTAFAPFYDGHCLPYVEFYNDGTGEWIDPATIKGEWNVTDFEPVYDLRVLEEPILYYMLYVEEVAGTEAQPQGFWFGGEGPLVLSDLERLFWEGVFE